MTVVVVDEIEVAVMVVTVEEREAKAIMRTPIMRCRTRENARRYERRAEIRFVEASADLECVSVGFRRSTMTLGYYLYLSK